MLMDMVSPHTNNVSCFRANREMVAPDFGFLQPWGKKPLNLAGNHAIPKAVDLCSRLFHSMRLALWRYRNLGGKIGGKKYLTYLAVQCRVASSIQNQAFNALLFLYRHVLKKDFGDQRDVPRAKRTYADTWHQRIQTISSARIQSPGGFENSRKTSKAHQARQIAYFSPQCSLSRPKTGPRIFYRLITTSGRSKQCWAMPM